jgi:hypothetical protein
MRREAIVFRGLRFPEEKMEQLIDDGGVEIPPRSEGTASEKLSD